MTTKNKKTSRLTEALLETAKDMKNAGILGDAAYDKITMRHLEMMDKPVIEPLTGEEIRMMREQACDFSRAFPHLFFTTIPPGPAL